MGYKLCIAEKPSVAKDIADVIGAKARCNGYYEGNGYRVTWAVGHLVGLAEPEAYGYVNQGDMWKEKKDEAYAELPLIPEEFKLIVLESTKDQFQIVKKLINDPETDEIIDCGDMGPEGHILQWFIRQKAGYTKPVKRFCATSMTEEAIRDAMKHLRSTAEFEGVIRGEFCKKKADWIMGMSMSRVESLKHGTNITVGRVQSPTLYFVVKRYLEVMKFKVTDYYTLDAAMADGFHVFWNKDTQGIFPAKVKDGMRRVLDKNAVELKRREIEQGRKGIIRNVVKEKKVNNRPQLFDILELQRTANRKYGYSAAETLATAQALYETQKVLSYPRTDSRYITEDLSPYMAERIKGIGTIPKYAKEAELLLKNGLNIDKKIVDNSKVTDHHALIPTEKIKGFDPDSMTPTPEERKKGVTAESMKNILDLVLCRMIVSFSQPNYFEKTDVAVEFSNGMIFTATGRKDTFKGWVAVEERLSGKEVEEADAEADKEQEFPELNMGQVVYVTRCALVPKKTTPPKLHTEDTLLSAMKNAGRNIDNGEVLEGKGIGTQATRAEIIKKLFDSEYVTTQKKGKTNYIVPTKKGMNTIRVLPHELYSPQITADWEMKIAKIADGEMTEKQFMDEFKTFIREKIDKVKNTESNVSFEKEREVVGECPWCGFDLWRYENKDEKTGKVTSVSHYCSNKGKCDFSLRSDNPTVGTWTGKKLTETQMQRIVSYGFITLQCKSKTKGAPDYKRKFVLGKNEKNGRTFAKITCEPLKGKDKK